MGHTRRGKRADDGVCGAQTDVASFRSLILLSALPIWRVILRSKPSACKQVLVLAVLFLEFTGNCLLFI